MKSRRAKPGWQKDLAKERIETLFGEADRCFHDYPEKSHRYIGLARRIGMRYRTRMPPHLKRKFCKHCYSYLRPGVNCTFRLSQKRYPKVVITCKECGKVMRIPYLKAKANK
jgi:ribonuclease P protein subunit RPR2